VRRIFDEAKAGAGPAMIARGLNESGESGPQGGTWSRQVVTGILRNPVYAGDRYGVKGAQPAIVTRRLWNSANR